MEVNALIMLSNNASHSLTSSQRHNILAFDGVFANGTVVLAVHLFCDALHFKIAPYLQRVDV